MKLMLMPPLIVPLLPQIQRDAAAVLQPYFTSTGLVIKALEHASKLEHIMDFTRMRCMGSLFSMLHQACRNVAQYNNNHPDFPMPVDQLERYMQVSRPPPPPSGWVLEDLEAGPCGSSTAN